MTLHMHCAAGRYVEFSGEMKGQQHSVVHFGADEEMEHVDAEEDAQPLPSDMFMAG